MSFTGRVIRLAHHLVSRTRRTLAGGLSSGCSCGDGQRRDPHTIPIGGDSFKMALQKRDESSQRSSGQYGRGSRTEPNIFIFSSVIFFCFFIFWKAPNLSHSHGNVSKFGTPSVSSLDWLFHIFSFFSHRHLSMGNLYFTCRGNKDNIKYNILHISLFSV